MTILSKMGMALRFSLSSAAIAGTALIIVGSLFWVYSIRQLTDRELLTLRLHAEFDADRAGTILHNVNSTIATLADNSVLANALVDSVGKATYLGPFLNGFQRISGIPIDIYFTDFEGELIATNGAHEPYPEELTWLKAVLASGKSQATILPPKQDGARSILATELLSYSRSREPEGALLYRIPLNVLVKGGNAGFLFGLEEPQISPEHLMVSVPLVTDDIFAPLIMRYQLTVNKADILPSQTATLGVLALAALAVMALVLFVSRLIACRLTRSLVSLEEFASSVIHDGFSDRRATVSGPPEVVSLGATVNIMLDRLAAAHAELEVKARNELSNERDRFTLAVAASNDGIWDWDIESDTIRLSPRCLEMLGLDPCEPETVARVWWEKILDAESHRCLMERINNCSLGREDEFSILLPFRHTSGDIRYLLARAIGKRSNQGGVDRIIGALTDLTDLKRADDNRKDQIIFQHSLIEAMPVAVFHKNELGVYLGCNNKYANLLGLSVNDIIGHRSDDLFPVEIAADVNRSDQRAYQSREPDSYDFVWVFGNTGGRHFRVYKAPYARSDGSLGGLIGIVLDISSDFQREESLRQAEMSAIQANLAKSQFLAMMSHEIRTPITGVLGMADLLRRTPLNEEQIGYLDTLAGSTKTLLTILNDILDISKIEAGKVVFEEVDFDLREAVNNTISMFNENAVSKGLALTHELDDDLPKHVIGDPTRVKQILFNLSGNAIKFTETGGVHVRVSIERHDDITLTLLVEVEDTGIGMTPDQIPHLFKPFSQLGASTTRRFGGTGLGLVITKRLVELMGGTIGVDSEPGKGTTFWFSLPLRVASDHAISIAEDAVPPAPTVVRSLHILLAEDNRINQMLVRSMLQKLGHTVAVADNGRVAVAMLAAEEFDAVLMDMQMPEMDGEEATRVIRVMPPPKGRLPILALTADAMVEHRERYLAAGVNDLVPKPIDWQVLSDALAIHTASKVDQAIPIGKR
ncbi:MAG: ATP-binding protein [Rhodospirillaceae bacterium]